MGETCIKPREELVMVLDRINKTLNFKNEHLELLSDTRINEFITFLELHFFPDETLSKSIGFVVDEVMPGHLKDVLRENLSIMLIDNKSNAIIGCRGMTIIRKQDDSTIIRPPNKEWDRILEFVDHRNESINVFKRFNVDTAVAFTFLCTHKDYRGKGLASLMFQAAILFCKELGINPVCIKGEASARYSQRIYEKFGFETTHTLLHDEYKLSGEIIFKNTGHEDCTKCYLIQL